ncbi:hypothetical protein [Mycobacterium sp.]|nr:hypothetical protein [Mycobacterium sp.]
MQSRVLLAGSASVGMITAALMQAGVALADALGADAFAIGSTTFDPY